MITLERLSLLSAACDNEKVAVNIMGDRGIKLLKIIPLNWHRQHHKFEGA